MTVIDISRSLNLSLKDLSRTPKALVVEDGDTVVGVIVEDIRDAMFVISPNDIKATSDLAAPVQQKYIQGTALYRDQVLHILDLPLLLQSEEVVINEMV